jgi:hypothetical protein
VSDPRSYLMKKLNDWFREVMISRKSSTTSADSNTTITDSASTAPINSVNKGNINTTEPISLPVTHSIQQNVANFSESENTESIKQNTQKETTENELCEQVKISSVTDAASVIKDVVEETNDKGNQKENESFVQNKPPSNITDRIESNNQNSDDSQSENDNNEDDAQDDFSDDDDTDSNEEANSPDQNSRIRNSKRRKQIGKRREDSLARFIEA